ncbi:MAG: M20/M25/M40 family metallo-hydrolase [Oscillospiraceae bacterium]|nr:M20/M25/M40 family metallo-hydrolase [Oscillospiraceae bacterium]
MRLERLTLLEELLNARGVSGDEGEIRKLIGELCAKRGARTITDALGNIIAYKEKPGAKRVMLDAHMDEVGFLITGADANGTLKYQPVGGIDPRVVISKRVEIGKDRVPGVIGVKPIHISTKDDMENALKHKDLRIDIGAKDAAEAERFCPAGSYASFVSPPTRFGEERIVSRALDDRVGCLALLAALESDLPVDLICAFTAQEEVGLRGALVAAKRIRPDIGIALEGTTCNDLGDVSSEKQVVALGKGVAISFMDNSSIAHPKLRAALTDCAEVNGIAHQIKRGVAGGNDAGAIQRAYSGCPTATLSVPCRYIHSANSVANLSDIESQSELVIAFLRDFAQYEGRIFE